MPIERLSSGPEQVSDVGPVISLALHDERLGPNRFFSRTESHGVTEHNLRDGMLEPKLIDAGHTVARAENDVDEAVPLANLAQPMRESELGFVSAGRQCGQDARSVF